MWEFFIILIIVLLVVIISYFINTKQKQTRLKRVLDKLSEIGVVNKSQIKAYDYDLIINEVKYLIKLVNIGRYKEVSFNSNSHWQLKPDKKLQLINPQGFDKLLGHKIIILIGSPEKVVKYINENEIVFVKPLDKCYTYNVFLEEELELFESFIRK